MSYASLMVDVGAERSYPIEIFVGNLDQIGDDFGVIPSARNALIVTNTVVEGYYLSALKKGIGKNFQRIFHISLDDGEAAKNWNSLNKIYDVLLQNECDRNTVIFAFFTQQMQGGIRRAVGAIGNVVCLRASKLELGVEKSHLQDTVKLQFFNQIIGQRREVIEIQEVFHARGRDQQRRIALFGRDRVQRQELAPQIAQQRLWLRRRADHVMHLPFDVHAFGKRA